MEYKVFDTHVHIFASKIAEKAVKNLAEYYNVPMAATGTRKDILERLDSAPQVKKCLIHATATKETQVTKLNDYIAAVAKCDERFIGFGSMHEGFEDKENELLRIQEMGLHGIKMHCDFQGFNADSEKAMKIYEYAEGKLPVLFHVGDKVSDKAHPKRIANIIQSFPSLTVIAAHLGGYMRWDDADKYLLGKNLYLDLSSSIQYIPKERSVYMIRKHGADKCLFGSDYPMHDIKKCIELFLSLGLTEEENRMILWDNAAKLFGEN